MNDNGLAKAIESLLGGSTPTCSLLTPLTLSVGAPNVGDKITLNLTVA